MQEQAFLIEKKQLFPWLEELQKEFQLIGPVEQERVPAFAKIQSVKDLNLDYGLTMLGPQVHLYHPEERICTIQERGGKFDVQTVETAPRQVLFGVHSCDLHAITVLDRAFLKKGILDRNYRLWRENTVVIGLHCSHIYPQCFCASMGTGPFFEPKHGYDLLLTDLGDSYLAETLIDPPHLTSSATGTPCLKGTGRDRALELLSSLNPAQATQEHFDKKSQIGRKLESQFQKEIDTSHLVDIILRNQDHPVWSQTADSRCLGCTNCTQVCPTCFCYNVKDRISFDLTTCERTRYKDSCQELHFAQVHGMNFRSTRTARLRQFVTHKLATWVEQFGCFGCVGCGRCMTWCPTNIDLTHMAKEIMATEKFYAARRAEKRAEW
jgi:sulfhydrogenase subunit beta (sulfur reductase)